MIPVKHSIFDGVETAFGAPDKYKIQSIKLSLRKHIKKQVEMPINKFKI